MAIHTGQAYIHLVKVINKHPSQMCTTHSVVKSNHQKEAHLPCRCPFWMATSTIQGVEKLESSGQRSWTNARYNQTPLSACPLGRFWPQNDTSMQHLTTYNCNRVHVRSKLCPLCFHVAVSHFPDLFSWLACLYRFLLPPPSTQHSILEAISIEVSLAAQVSGKAAALPQKDVMPFQHDYSDL